MYVTQHIETRVENKDKVNNSVGIETLSLDKQNAWKQDIYQYQSVNCNRILFAQRIVFVLFFAFLVFSTISWRWRKKIFPHIFSPSATVLHFHLLPDMFETKFLYITFSMLLFDKSIENVRTMKADL